MQRQGSRADLWNFWSASTGTTSFFGGVSKVRSGRSKAHTSSRIPQYCLGLLVVELTISELSQRHQISQTCKNLCNSRHIRVSERDRCPTTSVATKKKNAARDWTRGHMLQMYNKQHVNDMDTPQRRRAHSCRASPPWGREGWDLPDGST